jgi:hypothetical protein
VLVFDTLLFWFLGFFVLWYFGNPTNTLYPNLIFKFPQEVSSSASTDSEFWEPYQYTLSQPCYSSYGVSATHVAAPRRDTQSLPIIVVLEVQGKDDRFSHPYTVYREHRYTLYREHIFSQGKDDRFSHPFYSKRNPLPPVLSSERAHTAAGVFTATCPWALLVDLRLLVPAACRLVCNLNPNLNPKPFARACSSCSMHISM